MHKKGTHPLNGLALLLSDADLLRARWQLHVLVAVLCQQLHELFGVLRNDLRQLRIASRDLLQDGLEHLRLLLHDLTKLLELWVVAEEVEVSVRSTSTSALPTTGSTSSCCSTTTTSSTRTASATLGSRLEEVDRLVTTTLRGLRLSTGLSRTSVTASYLLSLCLTCWPLRLRLLLLRRCLLLLHTLRNASQQVLNGAIGVVEGCAHGTIDLISREAHALHGLNGFVALVAHGKGGGIVEGCPTAGARHTDSTTTATSCRRRSSWSG